MLHLGYTTFTYKTKQKNETVKEGGFSLENYAHSCETNLPEKMAAGLRTLLITFQAIYAISRLFFVRLEGPKSLET